MIQPTNDRNGGGDYRSTSILYCATKKDEEKKNGEAIYRKALSAYLGLMLLCTLWCLKGYFASIFICGMATGMELNSRRSLVAEILLGFNYETQRETDRDAITQNH